VFAVGRLLVLDNIVYFFAGEIIYDPVAIKANYLGTWFIIDFPAAIGEPPFTTGRLFRCKYGKD
jgi:hypothetical protein